MFLGPEGTIKTQRHLAGLLECPGLVMRPFFLGVSVGYSGLLSEVRDHTVFLLAALWPPQSSSDQNLPSEKRGEEG